MFESLRNVNVYSHRIPLCNTRKTSVLLRQIAFSSTPQKRSGDIAPLIHIIGHIANKKIPS